MVMSAVKLFLVDQMQVYVISKIVQAVAMVFITVDGTFLTRSNSVYRIVVPDLDCGVVVVNVRIGNIYTPPHGPVVSHLK